VDGHDPGALIERASTNVNCRVRAEAQSSAPFDRLEIIANGHVVADADHAGGVQPTIIEADVPLPEGGWLAARCVEGRQSAKGGKMELITAHTAAVYVRVNGQPPPKDSRAVTLLQHSLDETLRWVERKGRFENGKQKDRLLLILRTARDKLEAIVLSS